MNRLCITMGDPAGVGPELVVRLLDHLSGKDYPLALIGDRKVLESAAAKFGGRKAQSILQNAPALTGENIPRDAGRVVILSLSNLDPHRISKQRGSKLHGRASWDYIEAAVRLCKSGSCSGMVTLPVSKESLMKAGCPFPGHTDLLAALDGAPQALMLMALDRLRVALVTHHIPLKDVPARIESRQIFFILKLMSDSLSRDFRISHPRIAVLGLNPHAGENGRLGKEEVRSINPAIRAARRRGILASGPHPADTVFHRALAGEFDGLVAMYHDQGIGPLKTLDFEKVVNITLGLSFVRTSPGHGTAYDIAWSGKAAPQSLFEAFRMARTLSRNRERSNG